MPEKRKRVEVPLPEGKFGPLAKTIEQVRLALALLGDNRVNLLLKLIPIAGIAYAFSPLDFIPAVLFFVFGVVDDVAVVMLAITMFNSLAPEEAVTDHLYRLRFGNRITVRHDDEGIVIEMQKDRENDPSR